MAKAIVGAIVGLVLGAIVGAVVVRHQTAPRLEAAGQETARLNALLVDLQRAAKESDEEAARLKDRLTELAEELRLAKTERPEQPEPEAPPVAFDLSQLFAGVEAEPEVDARAGPRTEGGRRRWGDLSPEDREAMTERRREFTGQMRERVTTFLQDQMMQSRDATEQERLAALQEYFDYMADVRERMREAETEEEREELGGLLRQSGEEMRNLVRDQQDLLVREVAKDYGITDPQKQVEFAERLQELRSSPFFWGPMTFGGGGFGDRGGRGPGPGRGRR